jgi:hypothetical protein
LGLSKADAQNLDYASRGSFLRLPIIKARAIIDRFCEHTHCLNIFPEDELPSKQKEEVLIAKSQSVQSQDSAIHPESPMPQNPPCEFKGNIEDFGRAIISSPRKRPLNMHIQKFLMEESLRKRPYSHIGHWDEPKDGMPSNAIVGEQGHLEYNPILSSSMPTLDNFYEPIIEPILDLDESSNALSPKPPHDPRNPSTHPTYKNYLDHKEDREEQHQWLESTKSLCAIAIEWMDEAIDKTNLTDNNPREILDIYKESPLEVENDGDIIEQGSYFINTSSSPCSYEKALDSPSLSNITPHEIFNPLMLPVPKDFKRMVVDAYVYHKYCRSRYVES